MRIIHSRIWEKLYRGVNGRWNICRRTRFKTTYVLFSSTIHSRIESFTSRRISPCSPWSTVFLPLRALFLLQATRPTRGRPPIIQPPRARPRHPGPVTYRLVRRVYGAPVAEGFVCIFVHRRRHGREESRCVRPLSITARGMLRVCVCVSGIRRERIPNHDDAGTRGCLAGANAKSESARPGHYIQAVWECESFVIYA